MFIILLDCCFLCDFAGSKSVSIQSAIPNTKCAIFDDNSVREVHPHGPNLPSLVTPVIPVVDGGIHNPVVLAGSTTPKLCDEVCLFFVVILLLPAILVLKYLFCIFFGSVGCG